jgi:hypothetical protein
VPFFAGALPAPPSSPGRFSRGALGRQQPAPWQQMDSSNCDAAPARTGFRAGIHPRFQLLVPRDLSACGARCWCMAGLGHGHVGERAEEHRHPKGCTQLFHVNLLHGPSAASLQH